MEKEETRIIFTSPEEMAGRRKHIKAFKNVKERPQLVEDSNEKVRNVCELMILEGFSDELIDWLLTLCSDPDRKAGRGREGRPDCLFDPLQYRVSARGGLCIRKIEKVFSLNFL